MAGGRSNQLRVQAYAESLTCPFCGKQTKDDLFLAADSKKEAASWEKALIKGSMWHAENKNQNAASSSRAAAGGAGGGLTPEQVENVGHTFKFQSVKSASPALKDDGSGGVGVIEKPVGLEPLERSEHRPAADSLAPPVPPRTSGTAPEKEAGLRVKFLKVKLSGESLSDALMSSCSLTELCLIVAGPFSVGAAICTTRAVANAVPRRYDIRDYQRQTDAGNVDPAAASLYVAAFTL